MKIFTVTFSYAHNYGAALQEYALYRILSDMKYDVKVLDYNDENISRLYKVMNITGNDVKSKLKSIFRNLYYFRDNYIRYSKFNNFYQ